MARPKLENGFIRIAVELFEAIARTRIPGEARSVFDAIIRQTYGWNRKEAAISFRDLAGMTGLKKPNVVRAVAALESSKMISVVRPEWGTSTISVNKNFEEWIKIDYRNAARFKAQKGIDQDTHLENERVSTRIPIRVSTRIPIRVSTRIPIEPRKPLPVKRIREPKDSYKQLKTYTTENADPIIRNSVVLALHFKSTLPERLQKKIGDADLAKWAQEFHRLQNDGHDEKTLRALVVYFRADQFWSTNFLSPMKLRKRNGDGIRYVDYFIERMAAPRRKPVDGYVGRRDEPKPADERASIAASLAELRSIPEADRDQNLNSSIRRMAAKLEKLDSEGAS